MKSFSQKVGGNSRSVRDSYIQISNFLRGRRSPSLACQHKCPRNITPLRLYDFGQSRAFNSSQKLKIQEGKDIRSTFPTPAEIDGRQGQPNNEANQNISGENLARESNHATNGHMNPETAAITPSTAESGPSSEVREILRRYELFNSIVKQKPKELSGWRLAGTTSRYSSSSPSSQNIEIDGFITTERVVSKSKGLSFLQLVDPHMRNVIQLVLTQEKPSGNAGYRPLNITPHTPVRVKGKLVFRNSENKDNNEIVPRRVGTQSRSGPSVPDDQTIPRFDPYVGHVRGLDMLEVLVKADDIIPLNSFPPTVIAKANTNFPLEQRHLQMRTNSDLRRSIRTRSMLAARSRQFFFGRGFDEVETPLLFKSTPEGAREFVVPTRQNGMAYALPQSPQQYKQLLMASGVSRYFQFAKCFRDEDMRADRQPEFTQLDLEMSFATRFKVMHLVEFLVTKVLWPSIKNPDQRTALFPKPSELRSHLIPVISYQDAMTMYGSDKPDLRLESKLQRVEDVIPSALKGMLTSLEGPIIEMFKLPMNGLNPEESSKFIGEFLDAPSSSEYLSNPAGQPGVGVYDPTKPLNGLASFGHEAAAKVEENFSPEVGDLFLIQARPDSPLSGASTPLGNLRRDVYQAALAQELLPKPEPSFLWVVDFPLFSPVADAEPGQGGGAGICSTHHPFTAPKGGQDLRKLYTDPLSIIGDHYDLVINGVEVGGGSQRIHDATMQELIFRDVLKMKPERIEDFRHLLDALASGCPPHAGFALGFDRLMAVLLGKDSIRDVIAFPKAGSGEDKMVSSPTRLTQEQLSTYHLAVMPETQPQESPPISLKA